MLTVEDKVRIREDVDYQTLEFMTGSCVLVFPELVQWLKTSSAGRYIFEELRGDARPVAQLVSEVGGRYGISEEAVRQPVMSLLGGLDDIGLLQVNGVDTQLPEVIDVASQNLQQVWLNVTDSCNFKCPYCYVPGLQARAKHMDTELMLRVVDEAADMGVVELVFAGGEPTLHPDLIPVLAHARAKDKFHLKVVTNGSRDSADYLDELCPLIHDLQVSVDGAAEATHDHLRGSGSFRRLSAVFAHVQEHHAELNRGISFTPTPDSVAEIPQLYKLALSLGAKYVHINRPKAPGTSHVTEDLRVADFTGGDFFGRVIAAYDELTANAYKDRIVHVGFDKRIDVSILGSFDPGSELYAGVRKTRCAAGVLTMCIRPDGQCYPCAALCAEEHACGSVVGTPLADAYRNLRVRVEGQFSVDRDPECSQCMFANFCGGGCRAVGDSALERDEHCEVLKERFMQWLGNVGVPKKSAPAAPAAGEEAPDPAEGAEAPQRSNVGCA